MKHRSMKVLTLGSALIGLTAMLMASGASAPDKVVIWAPGDNGNVKDWKTDVVLNAVEKATNTNIEVVKIGWDVYSDRVNAAVAAGKVPDIISQIDHNNRTLIAQLARDGVIAPYEGAVAAAAPNVIAQYKKDPALNALKVNGKIYGQPIFWDQGQTGFSNVVHVRKDILVKLKMAPPSTFEQFGKYLANCQKTLNLTGLVFNGKDEGTLTTDMFVLSGAWGVTPGWVKTADGWQFANTQPGMKSALLTMQKWAAGGMIDPVSWESDQDAARARFVSGKSCALLFNGGGHIGRIQNDMNLLNKGYQEWVLPALSAGNKTRGYPVGPAFWAETFLGNLKGNNPVAAARVINYLASKEGLKLTAVGIEGRDYAMQNGEIVLNNENRAKDGFPAAAGDTGAHPLATPIVSWVPQEWQDFQLMYGHDKAFKSWYSQMWANMRRFKIVSYGSLTTSPAWTKFAATSADLTNRAFVEIIKSSGVADAGAKFDQYVKDWKAQGGEVATAEMDKAISGK